MSKLTDTQMLVLASACERADGIATRPKALNRTAVVKVAAKLLEQGLVQEMPAKLGWPIWRMNDEGKAFSLKILKPGRAVIKGRAKGAPMGSPAEASPTGSSRSHDGGDRQPAETSAMTAQPKAGSKRNLILAMMQREGGATIGDLVAATGWLPHTTRAALTGLRKSGIAIARSRDPQTDTSVYRIEPSIAAAA